MEYSYEVSSTGPIPWGVVVIYLVVMIVLLTAMWKMFVKAGEKGWKVLIPFYNMHIMTKILDKPSRWFWGMFVPGMNIVVAFIRTFIAPFKLAEKFGKSSGFGVGLLFLGLIFYPILGFGKAEYVGHDTKKEVVHA